MTNEPFIARQQKNMRATSPKSSLATSPPSFKHPALSSLTIQHSNENSQDLYRLETRPKPPVVYPSFYQTKSRTQANNLYHRLMVTSSTSSDNLNSIQQEGSDEQHLDCLLQQGRSAHERFVPQGLLQHFEKIYVFPSPTMPSQLTLGSPRHSSGLTNLLSSPTGVQQTRHIENVELTNRFFDNVWEVNEEMIYRKTNCVLSVSSTMDNSGFTSSRSPTQSSLPAHHLSQALSSVAAENGSKVPNGSDRFLRQLSALQTKEDEKALEALGDSSPIPQSFLLENVANGKKNESPKNASIGHTLKGAFLGLKKSPKKTDSTSDLKVDTSKEQKKENRKLKTFSMRFSGFWGGNMSKDKDEVPPSVPKHGYSDSNVSLMLGFTETKAADIYDEVDILTEEKKLEDITKESLNDDMVAYLNKLVLTLNNSRRTTIGSSMNMSPPSFTVSGTEASLKNNFCEERLMMLLRPCFEYKPLDMVLCQRTLPTLEFPIKSKLSFLLSVSNFALNNTDTRELFSFSIALYDVKNEKKISEDWNFNFLSELQLQTLPQSAQDKLRMLQSSCQERVFNVSYPHDQIYCVVVVKRIAPCTSVQVAAEEISAGTYTQTDNDKKKALYHFEQSFLLGYCRLFIQRRTSSASSFSQLSVIDEEPKSDLAFSRLNIERFYPIIVDTNVDNFNICTMLKNLESQHLMAYHIKGSITVETRLLLDWKSQSFSRSSIYKSPYNNDSFDLENGTSLDDWDERSMDFSRTALGRGSLDITRKRPIRVSSIDEDASFEDSVEEIPWSKSRYPHSSLKNIMYLNLKFARVFCDKSIKFIMIEVAIRESDKTAPTNDDYTSNTTNKMLRRIVGKYSNKFQRYQFSGLSCCGKKNIHFVDEIKLDLLGINSENVHSGHHLLFTFYHIDYDNEAKKERHKGVRYIDPNTDTRKHHFGTSIRGILGYSFLSLAAKNSVYENDKISFGDILPKFMSIRQSVINENLIIYSTLPAGYLSLGEKELSNHRISEKSKVNIDAQLISTVQPTDERLQIFFQAVSYFYKSTSLQKTSVLQYIVYHLLPKLHLIDFSTSMPFMYILLDIILEFLSYSYSDKFTQEINIHEKIRGELQSRLFEGLLICLKGFHGFSGNHSRGNRFFSGYIKYIFNNDTIHVHLLQLFVDYLAAHANNGLASGDTDICKYHWFVLDLVVKSLLISQSKDLKNYEEKRIVILVNQMNDKLLEVMHKLILAKTTGNNNLAFFSNRNIGLFIRDLIPIIPSSMRQIFDYYCKQVELSETKEVSPRLLSESLAIICDYNGIVEYSLRYENFMLKRFIAVLFESLERKDERLLFKVGKYFLNILVKLDFDERYQTREQRELVSGILFHELVEPFFKKGEELLLKLKQFNEINIIFSTAILWTMRNYNSEKLTNWWKEFTLKSLNEMNDLSVITDVLKFFKNVALSFRNISEQEEQRFNKTEFGNKIMQVLVYILQSLFIGSDGKMLEYIISLYKHLDDGVNDCDTNIEALFHKLINSIRHIAIQSLMRYDGNTCFLLVKNVIRHLITNFKDRIIPTNLNRSRDLSMKSLKIESKWRTLVAMVMLMEKSYEVLIFCPDANDLDYDSEVFRAHCSNCFEMLLADFDTCLVDGPRSTIIVDNEDYIVDTDSKSLKAATLDAAINKIHGFNVSDDNESTESFSRMFLLTYSLFSTPEEIIDILTERYKRLDQNDSISRINLEKTVARLVKEGFYAFNNLSIAKTIRFTREIETIAKSNCMNSDTAISSSLTKIQNALMFHLLSVQSSGSKGNVATSPNAESEESEDTTLRIPKGFTLQQLQTPQIPLSKWNHDKKLYKQLGITNPYNVTFDLLSWPSGEIAHQLTILESKFFLKIKPYEFYYIESKDLEIREKYSSNILFMQEHFKFVGHWANEIILIQNSDKERKKIFLKLLCIAQSCFKLYNLFAFMAIMGACRSTSVYRLKDLYEENKEVLKLYNELEESQKRVINIKDINALYDTVSLKRTPCVPYLGSFQSQVLFTKEGNRPLLKHPTNPNKSVINLKMMRILNKTLVRVQDLQDCCLNYQLQEIPYIQYIFTEELPNNLKTKNDEELWELSTKLLPYKGSLDKDKK